LLCGFGDGAGGLGADGLGSVETEELATFVRGFYDSVRYEGEAIVWIELECGFGVSGWRLLLFGFENRPRTCGPPTLASPGWAPGISCLDSYREVGFCLSIADAQQS
jgi:hypothetical protein